MWVERLDVCITIDKLYGKIRPSGVHINNQSINSITTKVWGDRG